MRDTLNGLDSTISLCLAHLEQNGRPSYYRIADYDQQNNELAPALTEKDFSDPYERLCHPTSLFSPSAEELYNTEADDFYYLQWAYDEDGPYQHPLNTQREDPSLGRICEPHEILFLKGHNGIHELRDALSNEGIPSHGKLTRKFYIVYNECDGHHVAIECNAKDFDENGTSVLLSKQRDSIRNTALSAPVVYLEDSLVIQTQHSRLPQRFVYADLDELEQRGTVLLRDLDYFAADYVKWFARETGAGLSRSDQRSLMAIAKKALTTPDYLEQYLGAPESDIELEKLEQKIGSLIEELPLEGIARVGETLLKNSQIRQACLDQCRQEANEELSKIQEDITSKLKELESATAEYQNTKDQLNAKLKEKDEVENQIASLSSKLDEEMDAYSSFIQELDSNVALKLGLRAIASQATRERNSASASAPIVYDACRNLNPPAADHDLRTIIAHNLINLKVASIDSSNTNRECFLLSTATISCLPYTNFICCPHPIASQLADATAIALSGKTSCRVHIPSDYRNAEEILSLIRNADSPVILVDNVIDPVNEGILSAIINHETEHIVLLPFTSHASIRLLARELWGRMFFAPAESLIVAPGKKRVEKCKRSSGTALPTPQKLDDIVDDSLDLDEVFQSISPSLGSKLLASATYATALQACESQPDAAPIPKRTVSQHLAVSVASDSDCSKSIEGLIQDDTGLTFLERALYAQ